MIFWFHRNAGWRPKVLPPRSTSGRKGVFSTRSPHRPNPIGLSAVRLERIEPAHPSPLLLRRAQRLLNKSFLDIISDIAPGGLDEVKALAGKKDE